MSADPSEWGPVLWKIIHTICENLGKHNKKITQNDELLYFYSFQRKLANILPCNACKIHHITYMKNIKEVSYNELKIYGKQYYYNLHKEINDEKKIISPEFDELVSIYGTVSYKDMNNLVKTLNNLYLKYFTFKYTKIDEYKEFQRALSMLRHIINI